MRIAFLKNHWHQTSASSAHLQLSKIERKEKKEYQLCTVMPLKKKTKPNITLKTLHVYTEKFSKWKHPKL